MKKLMLPLVALFCSASVMAQDAGSGEFKPASGNVTLEANVNLLGGSVNLNNSLNQINARYFLSDDMAVRIGLGLGMSKTENIANTDSMTTTDKMMAWSFMPGIEKHFAGTDRLSPYMGADLMIGATSYKGTDIDLGGSGTTEYEGVSTSGSNRSNSMFGLNVVGGCDFYFAKHIYLGYEIGLGVSTTKEKEYTITNTYTSGGTTTTTTINSGKDEGMKSFSFSPNIRNGIRFGFVF